MDNKYWRHGIFSPSSKGVQTTTVPTLLQGTVLMKTSAVKYLTIAFSGQ